MKVGELVKCIPTVSGDIERVGVVVDIHEGEWPNDWVLTGSHKDSEMALGRRVDVLWSTGKLTKGFAERTLEVVKK
ncbi:MAG: hypothetical protein CML56_01155 [Rhodobacteraceae bacterium]|nr:hypothetical protein [Paracoccaceae bacterium]